eukprot:CAMPEP_0184006708 /NCGR_PEP_ID=MMETSP0954-20121128/861_1 /TAXON_ID=627963 /ORGANISM="Aplanochytrium sp, Strain PBS07" /LENGTH=745 /DNA_ID=CAMNT_0026285323 /DNA_START=330 /DNA_END=2567 /DNA_ORIENTATION=-
MSTGSSPPNVEVELRGTVQKKPNGNLVIRGVWYFPEVGRGDNFIWEAKASQCKIDSNGVPKYMECEGTFDAWFSSVKESGIVLHFSRESWKNSRESDFHHNAAISETNGETRREEISSSSSSPPQSKRLLYSVSGRGQNALGKFSITGRLNVSLTFIASSNGTPTSVLRFTAKKKYEGVSSEDKNAVDYAERDRKALKRKKCSCDGSIFVPKRTKKGTGKGWRLNLERNPAEQSFDCYCCKASACFSTSDMIQLNETDRGKGVQNTCRRLGKKRRRPMEESFTSLTPNEARLRAQHWRRQQLCKNNGGYIQTTLPIPIIREAKPQRNGRVKVSWEVATQFSFSLALMTEASLSIRPVRSCSRSIHANKKEDIVIDFPPFALTREKNGSRNVLSPTRTFSHVVEGLLPGHYEVCVLLRPCGNPGFCDQTFDTVRVTVNASPPPPSEVTALTYAMSRGTKPFAVVSWSTKNRSRQELKTERSSRFLRNEQAINSFEICCQVYRKTRGDWVVHEPSRQRYYIGSDTNSNLAVFNCIVAELPRNKKIRIAVAAVGPDGPGDFAVSTTLDCSSQNSASICKPNCVICGEDISFSEKVNSSTELQKSAESDSSPSGPDCCSHLFHFGCLLKWSETKNSLNAQSQMESTCPLCCRSFKGIVKHKLKKALQNDRGITLVEEKLLNGFPFNPLSQEIPDSEWEYSQFCDVYDALFGELPPDSLRENFSSQLSILHRDADVLLSSIINEAIAPTP